METEILQEIGLTSSEIKVYTSLLELGSSSTGKIVDKSKASSSKIYEILDRLMQKGLVSFIIKSGVKYFEAAPPERIIDYFEEKEKKMEYQKEDLKKLIPILETKRKLSQYKSEATIYKGLKGIETAFYSSLDLLNKKDELLVTGIPPRTDILNRFLERFHNERQKRKIKGRILINKDAKGGIKSLRNNKLTKLKYIGELTPSATLIFKERVIIFPESKDVFVVVIDNKEVSESFKVQFESWWNQDTILTKGFDKLEIALDEMLEDLKDKGSYDVLGAAFGVKGNEKKYAEFFEKFHIEKRIPKGIPGRLLFQQGTSEVINDYRKSLFEKNSSFKFLPYKTESPVVLFPGNKKSLILIQEKEPTTIQINNEHVAKGLKKHFESLWNQDMIVYKGFEDVTNKFESMLDHMKSGDEYQVLGATYGSGGERLKKFFNTYHKKRFKRGIKVKLLSVPGHYGSVKKELIKSGDYNMVLGSVRNLPSEFTSGMQINLYKNNKVLMFLFGEEPMCFEIDSEIVHNNFKNYFNALWNQDVLVHKGSKEVVLAYEKALKSVTNNDDVIIFAAKPRNKENIEYNLDWNKKIHEKAKSVRLLYYGDNEENRKRAKEIEKQGPKTKMLPTQEILPLSTVVVGDTVLNSIWEEEPITLEIKNKTLADSFKTNFDMLWDQEVITYKGEAGVVQFFDNLLNEKDVWFIGGDFGIKKHFPKYWEEYKIKRIKNNSTWHDLLDVGATEIEDLSKDLYYEYKTLPAELKSPQAICITNKSVSNIIWSGKDTHIFEIKNKEVIESYKKYFNHLWNQETKVLRGLDAVQNLFEEMLRHGSCDLIGAKGYFIDRRPKFIEDWEKRAIKKRFKMRNIVDPGTKGHKITQFPFAETKYTLPKEFTELSVYWIYGNKVVISNWVEEEPLVVVIENKNMQEMYKKQFELLWNKEFKLV